LTIQLENISKRFGFEWIFKKINFQFDANGKYAIVAQTEVGNQLC